MSENYTLLSKTRAAARMGVHRATLRAMIAAGDGPPTTMLRRQERIRADVLAEWLDARTARAPADAASFGTAAEAMAAATDGANA